MAPDLSRSAAFPAGLRAGLRIAVLQAVLVPVGQPLFAKPAKVSVSEDDSEQRVRAAPPLLPTLRAWIVDDDSGAIGVTTGAPAVDADEQAREAFDRRIAEEEGDRRTRELSEAHAQMVAEQAELSRRMAEANERRRRAWLDEVAAIEAKCRQNPNDPCPPLPVRPPELRAGSNGIAISYAVAPFQAELRWARRIPLSRFPGSDNPANPPWQLRHKCGAGVLNDEWVITAAHCAAPGDLKSGLEVYVGTDDISSDRGVALDVVRVVPHPDYKPGDMYAHDIALLQVRPKRGERLPESVRPLTLATASPVGGAKVFVPGWGRIVETDRRPVAVLRRYPMAIIPFAQCQALPGYGPKKVHDRVLCAGGGGVKTCEGDSGGPLVVEGPRDSQGLRGHQVVGVVSWNKSTCDGRLDPRPGVYTNVARYSTWIKSVIGAPGQLAR